MAAASSFFSFSSSTVVAIGRAVVAISLSLSFNLVLFQTAFSQSGVVVHLLSASLILSGSSSVAAAMMLLSLLMAGAWGMVWGNIFHCKNWY